jgi:hypothetical protein
VINKSKLTPYDTQVLTLVALSAPSWYLAANGMGHQKFGDFKKSLWGWGLQATKDKAGTPDYRQLSWRAQLLLKQEWKRMVVSVVEERPERVNMGATALAQQAPSSQSLASVGASLFGQAFAQGGITGRNRPSLLGATSPPPPMPTATEIQMRAMGGELRRDLLEQQLMAMNAQQLFGMDLAAQNSPLAKQDPDS